MDVKTLLERLFAGDAAAAARLITVVENGAPEADAIMEGVAPRVGRAFRVGVTGPPGVGKSTLVDCMTKLYRERGLTVGVVAVDPSSPFSGGALLGDRVRMRECGADPEVFIRSMASRGHLGGLSEAAMDAADILDAMGKDVILTETVGVGQAEVEIAQAADVCVLVTSPGLGDSVQTLKAGLMEIADVYCVNKADRGGADIMVREINFLLQMCKRRDGWRQPVIETEATSGRGVESLLDALKRYREFLEADERFSENRKRMARRKVQAALEGAFTRALQRLANELDSAGEKVASGRASARRAAEDILRRLLEESRR